MANSRRKNDIRLRKRREEEGEDDEGSVAPALDDDSQSEDSAISDGDEDGDGDISEATETEVADTANGHHKSQPNGHHGVQNGQRGRSAPKSGTSLQARTPNDTDAMMNGLQVTRDERQDEGTNFEDMVEPAAPSPSNIKPEPTSKPFSVAEQRRREHEEYKKKRDADPAFVPNRGGFFMHDQRNANGHQIGFPPFGGKTRGKGRAGYAAAAGLGRNAGFVETSDAPWAHDLHETITAPVQHDPSSSRQTATQASPIRQGPVRLPVANYPNRTFSKTTRTGNVNIRVLLPGMTDPVIFSTVPTHQHTRLPHHRPPLRRDKPVRVCLPEMPIRYIFPSVERSFIFIPRAMRPNQQGFGRVRGRNSFNGGLAPYSSRRTSFYAGSNYTPSLAHSRRSSVARDSTHEGFMPPSAPSAQRSTIAVLEPAKPVVRLPPVALQAQQQEPEEPALRENRTEQIPMHQPKPQKTVVVADIEAPTFNPPPQQQQQPFHQQMPAQITSAMYPSDTTVYGHISQQSHPSQAGTPLAQIPERAIHAQPFQPYAYPSAPGFFYPQYPPPLVYYPQVDQNGNTLPPTAASMFVPGQPYPYTVPFVPPPPPPPATEPTSQAGTVAHESNGMVYYYDSSQMPQEGTAAASYPPHGYTAPAPGAAYMVNGVMTPPAPFVPTTSAEHHNAPQ